MLTQAVQTAVGPVVRWLTTYGSLCISSLALIVTVWNNRRGALRSMRPVLVITFRNDHWNVANVGNGPALDILMACKVPDGQWEKPVRLPPLSKDGQFELRWLNGVDDRGIGVRYRDIEGRWYTSQAGDDLTTIRNGNHLEHWDEKAIGRYWAENLVETHGYFGSMPKAN